jgi:hypothetical protein
VRTGEHEEIEKRRLTAKDTENAKKRRNLNGKM